MAIFYQTEQEESFQQQSLNYSMQENCQTAFSQFKQVITTYTLFHISFLSILILQLLTTIALFGNVNSIYFAIVIGSFIMTIFSYTIIAYYFQGKKSGEFAEIMKAFSLSSKKEIPVDLDDEEYHLTLANSLFQLTTYIAQVEVYAISLPPFKFIEDLNVKMCFWLNWRDILFMQELLMFESIREHIELVKLKPTSLSAHTSLANAYIALSKIYQKPQSPILSSSRFTQKVFEKPRLQERFQFATKRAIEELKILDGLAPNDPWVHAQLASCYHHMEMNEEEIKEYEFLLNLRPHDKEILLRLGILYFHLNMHAKGLKVYESLQKIDAKDAHHLISHYSSMFI